VTSNSISIGVTEQLSGEAAGFCSPIWAAAKAVIDQANASGGVAGRKIKYTVLDDGNIGPTGLANVKSLQQQGVLAVFGECGSVVAGAVAPYLEQNGIPFLFPYATVRAMAVPPLKQVFLMLPLLEEEGAGLVKYVFNKYGPGSVVFGADVIPGIQSTINTYKQIVTQDGGTWSGSFTTNTGTPDMTPLLLQLKADNPHPDYIFSNLSTGDMGGFAQAMVTQGYYPTKQLIGTNTVANQALITAHAAVFNRGSTLATAVALPGSAAAQACASILGQASPPIVVTPNTLFGCGEAQTLIAALQGAGRNLTPNTLRSVMLSWRNKDVSAVFPPLSFTSSFQVGEQEMFIDVVQNGTLVSTGVTVPTTEVSTG